MSAPLSEERIAKIVAAKRDGSKGVDSDDFVFAWIDPLSWDELDDLLAEVRQARQEKDIWACKDCGAVGREFTDRQSYTDCGFEHSTHCNECDSDNVGPLRDVFGDVVDEIKTARQEHTCVWTRHNYTGGQTYTSGCNRNRVYSASGNFCPQCGARVVIKGTEGK